MIDALLFGSSFLIFLGLLICGYSLSNWAAYRRRPLIAILSNLLVFVAAAVLGLLVWLADGYYMVHKREGAYGHAWTPEPIPGPEMPEPGWHRSPIPTEPYRSPGPPSNTR
jgi:hypothetical protein